jgi:hypothetical protein
VGAVPATTRRVEGLRGDGSATRAFRDRGWRDVEPDVHLRRFGRDGYRGRRDRHGIRDGWPDSQGGTATAAGGTDTLAFTWLAATGTAGASGGTVAFTDALAATGGSASAQGGTDSLAFTWTAASGTGTATGGTVTVSTTSGLTAQGGNATAALAGRTRSPSRSPPRPERQQAAGPSPPRARRGCSPQNGTATATGGTVTPRFTYASSTGTATATGGTVNRVNPSTGGTATASGTSPLLTWRLAVVSGTATAGAGTVTVFTPTFGHLDGGAGLTGVDEGLSGLTGVDESLSGLVGVIG